VQFEGGQQGPNLFADVGGLAPSQQILSTPTPTFTGSGAPGVNIPAPGGAATQVFEAGLLVARGPGESAGSDAGNPDGKAPTITQPGTITFTSPRTSSATLGKSSTMVAIRMENRI
jgi:hypothetical protein